MMIGMTDDLRTLLDQVADASLKREQPTRDQALAILRSSDADLLDVISAAGRVRRHFFGNRVKLNLIVNMKSGLCPEDRSTVFKHLSEQNVHRRHPALDAKQQIKTVSGKYRYVRIAQIGRAHV